MKQEIFPQKMIKGLIWQGWESLAAKFNLEKNLLTKDQIQIEHPINPVFGDYASSVAMAVFKKLKIIRLPKVKSPLDLANLFKEEILSQRPDFIKKIEAVSPGFLNFYLADKFLIDLGKAIFKSKTLKELKKIGRGKTVIIDYSSPNIARPFGVGHLRSTNIGQAIYNLYQSLGWKVIGDNHLGDWGTQFGKLIFQIKLKINELKLRKLTIADLEKLYVQFHQEAEKNPQLEEKARQWFKKLEEGEAEAKRIWQFCVEISKKEFARIYQLLGVRFDFELGESFYQDKMAEVLADAREKGVLKKSQGALVISIAGMKIPGMLVKSDGATTYLLRDLATIKYRVKTWHPDLIIYEVGADQKLHFKQLFIIAEMLGYCSKEKLVHIPHGMIRWSDGKFSTRKGKTIHLEAVIKEAIGKARKLIAKSETGRDLSKREKEKIAQAVGIGGIKFNDLKQEPQKDIVFDWEKILSLEGYAAPYLQYTYARCSSVLAKTTFKRFGIVANLRSGINYQQNKEEKALWRTFYQFPEIIDLAARHFSPHFLAVYLFDLSQKFNLFYQKHRILGERTQDKDKVVNSRLFLTATTAKILRSGLEILGIPVLERM